MDAVELLEELTARHFRVEADGESLRVVGPRGSLSPDLDEEIRENKRELLVLAPLQGWPPESLDCVRRFRQPHARLFPFLGRAVITPQGRGMLLQVFTDLAAVALDQEPRRAVFFLPSDIRPPGLAVTPSAPFEAVKG
jgi:hypothetical protein